MSNFIYPYLIDSFFYCKNKVYILKNNLAKTEHINISQGKIYDLDNIKLKFDGFEIDGIDKINKFILEYKKKKSNIIGAKYQLLYYLYLLKNIYPLFKGKIIYIENKEEEIVELTSFNKLKLLNVIKRIQKIDKFNINLTKNKKCKNCGLFEYCHS